MNGRIVRLWQARAPQAAIDAWFAGYQEKVLPRMRSIDGCSGVSVQVSDTADPRTLSVLTYWDSAEAMAEFVGPDRDEAVMPEWVAQLLPDHDGFATHSVEMLEEDFR